MDASFSRRYVPVFITYYFVFETGMSCIILIPHTHYPCTIHTVSPILGGVNRDSQLRFGLSPEEVGLILDQLPNHPVELARRVPPGGENGQGSMGVMIEDTPDKVLRITPGAGGSVSFRIDYEKDGVGGQIPAYGEDHAAGPLEVTAQLGEVQVVREIIRSSIPVLVGWNTMLEVAMQKSMDDARNSSPDFGGYSGGNGGNGGNVPF
jgi:hypothetical protein